MPVVFLALGFIVSTIGLIASALALALWKRGARDLLAFGAFAALYGVGLLARSTIFHPLIGVSTHVAVTVIWLVNYWLSIPALIYTEESRGAGWHQIIRRLWQAWIPLALVFTTIDIVTGAPGSFSLYYLPFVTVMLVVILVHVIASRYRYEGRRLQQVGGAIFVAAIIHDNLADAFWPGLGLRLEPLGVTAFLGSLGITTGRRFFARERELAVVEHEMKTARGIQESILPAARVSLPRLQIAARYLPMRGIAGDLYDFHIVDDHRVGVLVADVTGHGVPAALIASMVKVAFTAQRASAAEPGALLTAMNTSLCGNLTGQFVTAAYVFFDAHRNELRYSVAGHPPPLLWKRATQHHVELGEGSGIFMGFEPDTIYDDRRVTVAAGDRVLLYTDGLTETEDGAGHQFGDSRLRAAFTPGERLPAEQFASLLVQDLRSFSGLLGETRSFEDDLTLVVVDVGPHGAAA